MMLFMGIVPDNTTDNTFRVMLIMTCLFFFLFGWMMGTDPTPNFIYLLTAEAVCIQRIIIRLDTYYEKMTGGNSNQTKEV